MIETRYSPKGLLFYVDFERPHWRFDLLGSKSKSATPPPLPPPAQTPTEIVGRAAAVGETEGRRLRKKTGRRATRLTRPSLAFVPAPIAQAGLKTKLGATA